MSDGTTLLFGLPGVRVERVERRAKGIRVVHVVTADEAAAACPGCGVVSTSVKEQVRTSPKDIPYGHEDIVVHWHKIRWRCREDYCERSSFTEAIAQVPRAPAAPYGCAPRWPRRSATPAVQWLRSPRPTRCRGRPPTGRLSPTPRRCGRAGTRAGAGHRRDPAGKAPMAAVRRDEPVGAGRPVGHRVRRPGWRSGASGATRGPHGAAVIEWL